MRRHRALPVAMLRNISGRKGGFAQPRPAKRIWNGRRMLWPSCVIGLHATRALRVDAPPVIAHDGIADEGARAVGLDPEQLVNEYAVSGGGPVHHGHSEAAVRRRD